jgi:flagellar biosynthesis anti-sigma factor FlgM
VLASPASFRGFRNFNNYYEVGAEMEIKKTEGYIGQKATRVQELKTKVDSQKRESTKETGAQRSADLVRLSRDYQEMNKVKRVTMELPDIRNERVDQVRKQIADNTYQMNATQTADKMLEELR